MTKEALMPGFEIFGDEERKEVNEVLETGILFRYGFEPARKGRFKAVRFEEKLKKRTGAGFAHLCSSGTAALSTTLAACGIGAGDEVIVPPFTFVATFEAVLSAGAVPVFSEIDDTLCLDPEKLESVLTERTKAVMPVHMCGSMARIDEIRDFCRTRGLVLIEDACQSVGGSFNGKALGTFGEMGCFSFDFVKTVTCGEGGAVITDDKTLYEKADQYADHGHDHLGGNDRGADDHPIMGLNFRISELNAAVGVAQLEKLDRILSVQRENKKIIKDALQAYPDVSFRTIPDKNGDTATFLTFFLPDENKAAETAAKLAEQQIPCPYWYRNNWHYFANWHHLKQMKKTAKPGLELLPKVPDYSKVTLEQSDAFMKRALSMQIMLAWTKEDIEKRIEKLDTVFKG